jgi:hypothetical protein
MRNTTDYDFPPMWGQFSDQQKCEWYIRERVFRQAIRQDTAFGRRYRSVTNSKESTQTPPEGHTTIYQALENVSDEDPFRYN